MKKIGIVADNYKVERFKKELTKAGFEYQITPFKGETSTILVNTDDDKVGDVKKICEAVEFHFKRAN